MKRRNAESIGEIIAGFMQQEHADELSRQLRASSMWPQVVGQGVNRYTSRRWVKDGILHVNIVSAALKNELIMSRTAILHAINDLVPGDSPALKDIIIH